MASKWEILFSAQASLEITQIQKIFWKTKPIALNRRWEGLYISICTHQLLGMVNGHFNNIWNTFR